MTWSRERFYFRELALICSIAIVPGNALLYGQTAQQGEAMRRPTKSLVAQAPAPGA